MKHPYETILLVLIGFGALVLGFFEFLVSSHGGDPLLGEPAEDITEGDGVDEDVLVVDDVDSGNEWLGDAESEEVHLSHVGGIIEAHPNEGDDGEDLEDGTEGKAVGGFTQKVKDESKTNDEGTSPSVQAEAAAVARLVQFFKALNTFVLRNAGSNLVHISIILC